MKTRPRFAWSVIHVVIAGFCGLSEQSLAGRVVGHVPAAARELLPINDVPVASRLHLAIGLPLRDPNGLAAFLRDLTDPASPNFRKYLTPEQFTERFGPTAEEYQSVVNFAEANGLQVTATHPNRLVVDVSGTVADVQRTFHIRLRNFRHPTERRTFFAPDVEPVVDAPVPILQVAGLTNYWIPRPRVRTRAIDGPEARATSWGSGSGANGTFAGTDFRAAYVPGTSLNGAGQAVGLLEFDGYNPNDIAVYEQNTGLPAIPLQNVLVDGYSGGAGSGNGEVCLDIQMAVSMAPGLSAVIVYEAPNNSPWEDILSRMANDNAAKQLSSSWGGGPPSSTAEQIFQQMAAQGQTFFNATGDNDAFVGDVPFPSDSPNVVQVGGTELLTVSPGGGWSSETVWNWGRGSGSGGGISTFYSLPPWQQGLANGANQGSADFRNSPDVAMVADNVYTVSDNGRVSNSGGTSCSAPLWAGFTALANQQAAASGKQPVGFINPAVYAIGRRSEYSLLFHDISTGDNITSRSNGRFSAVSGYDLCTGWGTPTAALIQALVSPGAAVTSFTISISASPAEGGSVNGGGTFLEGASVTLTASASVGFVFTGWTENANLVSTSPSYGFSANANRNLVANFEKRQTTYQVTLSASPPGTGDVRGTGTYLSGTDVIVTAAPKRKFVFAGWFEGGELVSSSPYYSFTIDGDRDLVGQFVPKRGNGRRRK